MNATLSDQERKFFEKAKELNNMHYYFAKWTSFPTFIRKEGIFSVKLYFLETYMRKRTMYIQYDFDLDTQDLISSNQSSGPIQG
jgi:hypothetical protein